MLYKWYFKKARPLLSPITLPMGLYQLEQIKMAPNLLQGNIAEPRIINGTALYTSAFTPPAAPLTAVTNTNFLVKGINSSIIDKSQSIPSLFLWNDTKSSTAQYKFLTSSMYFDGTGDYISTQEKYCPSSKI